MKTILLVEDSVSLAAAYCAYLSDIDYDVVHVETGQSALEYVRHNPPTVILVDLNLPDMSGIDIIKTISDMNIKCQIIVITAHATEENSIQAMQSGAHDFLTKPFDASRLKVTVKNAIERHRLHNLVCKYEENIDRDHYCDFIGKSLAMQATYNTIESAAPSNATVFITGESGTGKELCADAVHKKSRRSDKPFIVINSAAIPNDLMESEIFGHVKGAFTGALSDRNGAAAQANGGTLFLDEVCEMNIDLQAKLLRFIQMGEYKKVGGNKLEHSDIRIICATNRDPLVEIKEGRFREDLYYRLHVIPIPLPPLRERGGDIIDIANMFISRYSKQEGKSFSGLTNEAEEALVKYKWPGNVRELQNTIHNIIVLNQGKVITIDMLAERIDYEYRGMPDGENIISSSVYNKDDRRKEESGLCREDDIKPFNLVEREVIEAAIDFCNGNILQAAAKLDISASKIYRKRKAWSK